MKGLALALLLAAACTSPNDDVSDCSEDRCEAAQSRDDLLDQVSGFGDPISAFLRDAVQEDGTLAGNYEQVLEGVGTQIGCERNTEKSFVVLSNQAFHAKTIFNRCADSPIDASEFFLLLPTLNEDLDVETSLIHMTAWDQDAQRYRRYATFPGDDGTMHINVEPSFCLGCHAGPRQLGTWQPLMNEMTNPWTQWNAAPGFVSHEFDDYLAEATQGGANYAEVSAEGLLDSASNFEPIIRAGIDRVTGARVQKRHDPADIDEALQLLQPLFCDEMVNYVSEIHGSGEIRSSALIDDSFRELLSAIGEGSELGFLSETTMQIAPQQDSESNLTLVAVRGESALRAELSLVTRQALSPLQALQVRSLDWTHPVASDFRCELFDAGAARIRAGVLDGEVSALGADATNLELLPLLLSEVMSLELDGEPLSLQPEGSVYLLDDADLAPASAMAWKELELSPAQLATRLQSAIDDASRDQLQRARDVRACQVAALLPTAPLIPDLRCE